MNCIRTFYIAKYIDLDHQNKRIAWGEDLAAHVAIQLNDFLNFHINCQIFEISLEGVAHMDCVFPRLAILEPFKQRIGRQTFFISNVHRSHFDNIEAAVYHANFAATLQLTTTLNVNSICPEAAQINDIVVLGPIKHAKKHIEHALRTNGDYTSGFACSLNEMVNNCSNKLKRLSEAGYLFREQRESVTGGIEYFYQPAHTVCSK